MSSCATVAKAMPQVSLADDVHARRSDVAWDIGERERLEPSAVAELAALVVAGGARTTRSSVHLHASFERDDKASGAIRFVRDRFGDDAGAALHRWAFVGDSGNDAACFAAFKTTFGVENVRAYARVAQRAAAMDRAVEARRRLRGDCEGHRVVALVTRDEPHARSSASSRQAIVCSDRRPPVRGWYLRIVRLGSLEQTRSWSR